MASFLTIIASCAVLSIAEMSAIDNNTTTVLNYVEKLTEDLGILQDQNLRFVFDQGEIKFHSSYKRKRE